MTTFRYKGLSPDGIEVRGVISAYDEFEAVSLLRESISIVTKIQEVPEANISKNKTFRIKTKELALLCSQLAIILRSGISAVDAVDMVSDQVKNKELQTRLRKVAADVDGGMTLAQGFEKNSPTLPQTFIETVRAGEASGTLDRCFARLHTFFDKSAKMRAKVVAALTYPAMVVAVAIIVIMVIMIFAVPAFTQTFESMGSELPAPTRMLIALSNFMTRFWWVLLMLAAALWGAWLIARKTPSGRRWLAEFSLTRSPLHSITAMNCAAQFASTMSTMLTAGLPLTKALEVTANVVSNYVFSVSVYKVREQVEQGRSIADSMKDMAIFPKMLSEMTGVGESSGTMEQTLDVVGDYYNNEVMIASERLLSLLEPCITIGLAVMTVFLLLAVYLPMFSMYGSLGA